MEPSRAAEGHEGKVAVDAAEMARALASLEAGDLRARKAAALLNTLDPMEAVAAVAGILRRADRASDPAAAALEGLLLAVREMLPEERIEELYLAAEEELEVQALFARSRASRSFDHDREQWVDREMRARTLGERRALARTHDRDLLARLAGDQDPMVVRHILQNPRCTEREVLVAAARRPQKIEGAGGDLPLAPLVGEPPRAPRHRAQSLQPAVAGVGRAGAVDRARSARSRRRPDRVSRRPRPGSPPFRQPHRRRGRVRRAGRYFFSTFCSGRRNGFLLRRDVDSVFPGDGALEVLDALAQSVPELRQLAGSENEEDHEKDEQQLAESQIHEE